jgi:DNA helicase HerA-like ATPase
MDPKVLEAARAAFPAGGPALVLGGVVHDGECDPEPVVRLPLAMANRHGLIAGATGTGKTKTLQLLAEQFSAAGVPVFLADLKGDLSGIAVAGKTDDRVTQRAKDTGYAWHAAGCPTEFLSLTGSAGAQLRATVSSFGPLLLSRVMGLNDTQSSVLSLVFKYADDKHLPLLDLADLRAVLQYLSGDGADELKDYGGMSKATVGVLLREMVELSQQGADVFFGEPEFDLNDLLRVDGGRGIVSVLELSDVQEKPALFSTFMMWMLARLYHDLPEVGDVEKPKLVFFFDEAHLLFDDANKAFLDQIEQVVRLIRSKGVGVYFVTQNPKDVPSTVLGQLGHRVQHALRAFTPDDDKALQAAARTYPKTPFYEVEKTLTSLGIGEAFVTVLTPQGTPTMPFATRMVPPGSRMGPLAADEMRQHLMVSDQVQHYATAVDRESAREMLAARVAVSAQASRDAAAPAAPASAGGMAAPQAGGTEAAIAGAAAVVGAALSSPIARAMATSVARSVGTQLARGLMGALLGGATRRRR